MRPVFPQATPAIWVTGYTNASNLPATPNAIQGTNAGGVDAFVQVYAQGLLKFSSFYGGSGTDQARAVGVDNCGNAFVVGTTNSTNFPVTANALQSANAGGYDGFIVNFQPGANFVSGGSYTPTVYYSTYLGGTGGDVINAVAVNSKGTNITVAGNTNSTNFPTTTGVFQTTYGGGAADAFVTKISTQ